MNNLIQIPRGEAGAELLNLDKIIWAKMTGGGTGSAALTLWLDGGPEALSFGGSVANQLFHLISKEAARMHPES